MKAFLFFYIFFLSWAAVCAWLAVDVLYGGHAIIISIILGCRQGRHFYRSTKVPILRLQP